MTPTNHFPLVIKGAYGSGNFGDDALMVAVHRMARSIFDNHEIAYLCKPANYIRDMLLPEARVLSLRRNDILEAELLLFGGGTQFYSFPLTAKSRTTAERIARLIRDPRALPRKLTGRLSGNSRKLMPDRYERLAAVGIGIGPFLAGSLEEGRARSLFADMGFVAVRDSKSYEICQAWGVKSLHHHADLCFWPGFFEKLVPLTIPTKRTTDRIGLVVRDWPHDVEGNSYSQGLFTVADTLRRMGKTVDFILFAGTSDRVWVEWLKSTEFGTVVWNPDIDTVAGFVQTLASYDLFITARYHGAVFAALLGRPAICIEVEPKLELLSRVLGPAGRCWKYPFDPQDCLRLVTEVEKSYCLILSCLEVVREQQSHLAEQMVNDFCDFVAGRGVYISS